MKRLLLLLLSSFFIAQPKPGLILLVAFFFVLVLTLSRKWPLDLERLGGEATAASLGWVRVVTCATLAICLSTEDVPSLSALPKAVMRSYGFGLDHLIADAFPGYLEIINDSGFLSGLNALTIALLVCGTAGLATRFTLPLAAVAAFVLGGIHRDYTHFFHTALLPWYVLVALCFLPAGDGFSVDRMIRRRRHWPVADEAEGSAYYGAARHAALAPIAFTYFATGLSKVRVSGVEWWSSANMKYYFVSDSLNQIELGNFDVALSFVEAPGILFSTMGAVGLFVELAGIFLFVDRRTHKVLPLLILSLHLGIFLFQGFIFVDTLILPLAFFSPFSAKSSAAFSPSPDRARFVAVATALAFFLGFGLNREYYPFSAWGMYAGTTKARSVDYTKVFVETADGRSTRTDLSEVVGALGQGRFLDQIHVFEKNADELSRASILFDACATEANRRDVYRSAVVAYRVELWRWDYGAAPRDPDRGALVETYRHSIAAASD